MYCFGMISGLTELPSAPLPSFYVLFISTSFQRILMELCPIPMGCDNPPSGPLSPRLATTTQEIQKSSSNGPSHARSSSPGIPTRHFFAKRVERFADDLELRLPGGEKHSSDVVIPEGCLLQSLAFTFQTFNWQWSALLTSSKTSFK